MLTATQRLSRSEMRERVLSALADDRFHQPEWLHGVFPCGEDDPEYADLMLKIDIGRYPVLLCSSYGHMQELRSRGYDDYLFLIIERGHDQATIRRKALHFFRQERRVRAAIGPRLQVFQ